MLRMNSLVRRLLNQFKGKVATPTNTNLNASPRQVSINEPRTTTMSDASAKGESSPRFFALQKGGSVVAKGNKLARNKPTKLY
jgi:hypothetical protein